MFHDPVVAGSVLVERCSNVPVNQTCRWVALCVARDFGLDPAVLIRATRGSPRAAFARQVAMYLVHVHFALSFEAIGRAFGRDRTTVSHACHVVEDSRDDFPLDCKLSALELICAGSPRHFEESIGKPTREKAR